MRLWKALGGLMLLMALPARAELGLSVEQSTGALVESAVDRLVMQSGEIDCVSLVSGGVLCAVGTDIVHKADLVIDDIRSLGAVCDGAITNGVVTGTDDTAAIQAVLNAVPPGATVVIPSGKSCLISSALTLKAGTRFLGEGGSRLIASTKQCTAGNFRASECDTDADCYNGGSSTTGLCVGTKFAPTAGTSYPMVNVVSGAVDKRDVIVSGIAFWTMQLSPYFTCGSGATGGRANKTCTTNDANADTGCPTTAVCNSTGPARWPSGPGKINPIDLSNAFGRVEVSRNNFYDLRVNDFAIKVAGATIDPAQVFGNVVQTVHEGLCCGPTGGSCATSLAGSNSQTCEFNNILFPPAFTFLDGIVCTSTCNVYDNVIRASQKGVTAAGAQSTIRNNKILMDQVVATSIGVNAASTDMNVARNVITMGAGTGTTLTGIYLGGANSVAESNTVTVGAGTTLIGIDQTTSTRATGNVITIAVATDTATGIRGGTNSDASFNVISTSLTSTNAVGLRLYNTNQTRLIGNFVSAYTCLKGAATNVQLQGTRCYFGDGPKVVVAGGAGWKLPADYFAWGQSNPVVQVGDNTAAAEAAGTGHLEIDSCTFFSQNAAAEAIAVLDIGKRCDAGSRTNLLCTTDDTNTTTGCPTLNTTCTAAGVPTSCCTGSGTGTCAATSCPGCCDATLHTAMRVANNEFLTGDTTIDLTALVTAGNTSLENSLFLGNVMPSAVAGYVFPVTSTKITKLSILSTHFGITTTPFTNWSWSYGDLIGNSPPLSMTAAQLAVGLCGNGNTIYCSNCDDFAQGAGSGGQATCINNRWKVDTTDWALQNVREWNIQKVDDIGGAPTLSMQGIDPTVNVVTGIATDLVDTTGTYVNYASAAVNPSNTGFRSSRFTLTRPNQVPNVTAVIKTGTEAVSTTTRIVVGLVSADATGSKSPTTLHVAALVFDTTGTPDTNWMCMTCSGAACTRTATSIAYATDTRYALKVVCNGTTCECLIGGKVEVTQTLTLPTSTQNLGYQMEAQTLAASSRALRFSRLGMLHR